jgi:uncharacterized protein YqjF (DUF2071 family)
MTLPSIDQRIDACRRPVGRHPVMYQKWRDLLFLHWEFPADIIQKSLPEGLTVDTHEGKAYLGLVPFFMQDIRPRFAPAVPGLSHFLEMNLRTYVYDRTGKPGVWFYSLDATQWLAVRIARTFFNLPYFDATITAQRGASIDYRASRKGCSPDFDCHLRYSEQEELPAPEPGSLEFFLVERYSLFAVNRAGTLFSGKVYHLPYLLRAVSAEVLQEGATALAGFERPARAPDHAIMSRGVDVNVYAIENLS